MIIGIPKELKIGENRVGATPGGVFNLVQAGHEVLVEEGAGVGSGFPDGEYGKVGGNLVSSAADSWGADMVIKVKEPIEDEFQYFRDDLLLFTFLHLAHPKLGALTQELIDRGVTAIAYETVQLPDGSLPLLEPMSEIAGRMAIQVAAHYLEKTHGGRGILMSGAVGVKPCNVVVLGAGTVGWNAAQVALGMGAQVTVLNRGRKRLNRVVETLGGILPGNLITMAMNHSNIREALKDADAVVGAVLTAGAKAPIIVTRDMIREMRPGSIIVDVSIDQGGIFETSRPTSHRNPVYLEEDVIHYCVTNMPGAVPWTSTVALTNVTIPYAQKLADHGFLKTVKSDEAVLRGVNTYKGRTTNQGVAEAHGLEYTPLHELI